jgi:hypothetical protein
MTMLKPVGGSRRRIRVAAAHTGHAGKKIKENGHDLAVYPVRHRVRGGLAIIRPRLCGIFYHNIYMY